MIQITKATKSFSGLFHPVLHDLNLCIKPEEFCVLIGSNGCGKSTLFKLISSELQPDSGEIEVQGQVSQVVQDVNLGTVPEMTLLENIALSAIRKPQFLFYQRYKEFIIEKLQELDPKLIEHLHQPLQRLSGGQRQLIATLMAIHSGKKILLLDEHTSALDPKMQALLMDYTAQQTRQHGLTTLMITHKMEDAIHYGDRLLMLHQGKIAFDLEKEQKASLSVNDLVQKFHHAQLLTGENDE